MVILSRLQNLLVSLELGQTYYAFPASSQAQFSLSSPSFRFSLQQLNYFNDTGFHDSIPNNEIVANV